MTAEKQTPTEKLGSEKGTTVPTRRRKKVTEIEKLRRERKKLQKLVEKLRQIIRVLKMKQIPKRTPKKRNIITNRAPKKRKVATKTESQVVETMEAQAEPNHEDME